MGISIRAYGRQRGVSEAAVRKAIRTGRIMPLADGSIDPVSADRDWQRHTDQSQQRARGKPVPNAAIAAVQETIAAGSQAPVAGGTTFLQARTANEVLKAQTNKLRLAKLRGELIERKAALAQVHALARSEREAWLNWPARIAALLASDLGVDAGTLARVLEQAVHTHLTELGSVALNLET